MHAILPLKDLADAKSRLAGLLQPAERRSLMQAMVEDVLQQLVEHPQITGVTLVSDDAGAGQLSASFGAEFIDERTLPCRGLNPVLEAAADIQFDKGAERLLILHGDLPLLSSQDLDEVIHRQVTSDELVIGCDEAGQGTNLLAFGLHGRPKFRFGSGSCAAHSEAASEVPVSYQLLRRPGIGLDVDEPDDLRQLLAQLPASKPHSRTAALLLNTELGRRLSRALSGDGSPLEKKIGEVNSVSNFPTALRTRLLTGEPPSREVALSLAQVSDVAALADVATELRDRGHGNIVTYSRKVFIPLTHLCRDVCHYCTFARTPKKIEQAYMPVDEVLELCHQGAKAGCQEALFTLGEKPELRYSTARNALAEMGFDTTLDYVREVASRVLAETGLLPHINAGCMTREEIVGLREVSASMGIMLESASERLTEKGMPHYGSPDKDPALRLATMELAGEEQVPFTSGILIGIGETRLERVESLLALRDVHQRHGHLQEIIVQNFRAKPGTLMAQAPEPDLNELLWTIAVARIVFGPEMNIQAPPNLSPGVLPQIVAAGINDWGGVSPLTPDYVNPEAPWPHLQRLASETATAGKFLEQRLTIYPAYACKSDRWLAPTLQGPVLKLMDAAGYGRRDSWVPGEDAPVPAIERELLSKQVNAAAISPALQEIVSRCEAGADLSEAEITRLFEARGDEFSYVVAAADRLRATAKGDSVSYVVNRNINYTNVCYFKCQFCAFSKGKQSENLRGRPYDISAEEIARRSREAWDRGATEVCMQGGIHPDYTGQTYLDILHTVRTATPNMHIHAFSPLEVMQGAETLGIGLKDYLQRLKLAGLSTLPGTAAEILHDEVRAELCADKLNSSEWLEVMEQAHQVGFRTTATVMYGHIEEPRHWARHLSEIRKLQQRTGGFTEFVPLPFVHMEAPMYLRGKSRRGPSFREAVLMHAVARLVFFGLIDNIQTSWVKMGKQGVVACLEAGANDLGGTLMNESITRAAGAEHGQEWSPPEMEAIIRSAGRSPWMRTTRYQEADPLQRQKAFNAPHLIATVNEGAGKRQRNKRLELRAIEAPDSTSYKLPTQQVVLMAACD
ncbi:MAG: 5-amino-6-(D-ribitylamino)uracil--L-tyrosine 4-hydroxyphenyl transferase CofH [Halioglobus sp.]